MAIQVEETSKDKKTTRKSREVEEAQVGDPKGGLRPQPKGSEPGSSPGQGSEFRKIKFQILLRSASTFHEYARCCPCVLTVFEHACTVDEDVAYADG